MVAHAATANMLIPVAWNNRACCAWPGRLRWDSATAGERLLILGPKAGQASEQVYTATGADITPVSMWCRNRRRRSEDDTAAASATAMCRWTITDDSCASFIHHPTVWRSVYTRQI